MSTPSDPVIQDSVSGYRASYNDGETASALAAMVRLEETGLVIVGDASTVIARWGWDDLRFSEPVAASRPIRLSCRANPGARLTIEDHSILERLRPKARYLSRDPFTRARACRLLAIVGLCAGIALFFVYGLPWLARPAASLVPVAWEEPVGESTVELVNKLFANGRPLCSNAKGVVALNALTAKLGNTIETPYDIRVDVADSPIVNALATPGGRIVLFLGLIDKAASADEVAGVLAHEMAHVLHRHPTQGMINSVGWASLMSVFTGGASLSNEAVARLAAHLATSAYTRDLESEADDGAAEMLAKSGIGNAGLANFFRSIQAQEIEGLSLPAYLSSHPETGDRIAAIEARKSDATAPALSKADWSALRDICGKAP